MNSPIKLPELPVRADWHDAFGVEVFTASQMRAYAEQAVREALAKAVSLCDRQSIAMVQERFHREASTARKLAMETEALIPENKQANVCGACNGTGRVVRDPDIGTDQECFVCDGSGRHE